MTKKGLLKLLNGEDWVYQLPNIHTIWKIKDDYLAKITKIFEREYEVNSETVIEACQEFIDSLVSSGAQYDNTLKGPYHIALFYAQQ